ncbi:MAG: hypothetical protein O2923_09175 [Verrucomicrobia bacterium]|nr:hypothetical protein [Verrucomicrobiota bacterium]
MNRDDEPKTRKITLRAFVLGMLVTGWFAYYTTYVNLSKAQYLAASQVPTGIFLLLVALVLLINPLLRLIRIVRPLGVTELMLIFIMGSVSIGIAVYGTMGQLVPVVGSLYNRHFNTEQAQWSLYLDPLLNEQFFLAEDGIQAAAIKHRDAHLAWQEADALLAAASALASSEEELTALDARRESLDGDGPSGDQVGRAVLDRRIELAQQTARRARERWKNYSDSHQRDRVLAEYPDRVVTLDAERNVARDALMLLKEKAFTRVDAFRRGLREVSRDDESGHAPRAIPGILYVKGEGADVYLARWRRTRTGVAAYHDIEKAVAMLDSDGAAADASEPLERAMDRLTTLADDVYFRDIHERLLVEIANSETERFELEATLGEIAAARRLADPEEFDDFDRKQSTASGRLADLNASLLSLTTERDRVAPQMQILDGVAAIRDQFRSLAARLATAPAGIADELRQTMAGLRYLDGSYQRFLAGDVNWSEWARPMASWTVVILLTYALLIALNVVLFRQWAHNEKLTYPLAELPTVLAGGEDGEDGHVPPVFRTGLFWAAFALSAGIHVWNHFNHGGQLGMYRPIVLSVRWDPFVTGTVFQGLSGLGRIDIIFTLIGLSFLIPARISFSLWVFHVFLMAEMLVIVWLGYGENIRSFPYDWSHELNFRTAQGTGALLVFAFVLLWRCRLYFACAWRPAVLDGLEPGERGELRAASFVFWIISITLIATLSGWMGANLWYTLFYYVVVIAISVAMTRAVTEGGIPMFQCFGGPLHIVRHTVGLNHAWTVPALYAPLQIYYLILFFDVKTFIAPAIANALKIRDNVRMSRLAFHAAVAIAILIGFGISALTSIIWCYAHGADGTAHPWFYTIFPDTAFNSIKQIAETQPVDEVGAKWWLASGGVLMAVLIVLRGRLFWVPHPLGLIMLVNPLIGSHWFSILLGWAFKSAIGKYGNRQTYLNMRNFFIGLMMGEILLIAVGWATMQYGF